MSGRPDGAAPGEAAPDPAGAAPGGAAADEGGGEAPVDGETARGEDAAGDGDGYEAPVGTLFLLVVYVMVLAGMWVTMYWMLVSR